MELPDFELVVKVHLTGSFNCSKAVPLLLCIHPFKKVVRLMRSIVPLFRRAIFPLPL